MNATNLKLELEQCLSWAEYANDFECFEFFDAKIAPLDSEYFTVEQIKALYTYTLDKSISLQGLYTYDSDGLSLAWLDDDGILGIGTNLLEAANDLLDSIVTWYKGVNQNGVL